MCKAGKWPKATREESRDDAKASSDTQVFANRCDRGLPDRLRAAGCVVGAELLAVRIIQPPAVGAHLAIPGHINEGVHLRTPFPFDGGFD